MDNMVSIRKNSFVRPRIVVDDTVLGALHGYTLGDGVGVPRIRFDFSQRYVVLPAQSRLWGLNPTETKLLDCILDWLLQPILPKYSPSVEEVMNLCKNIIRQYVIGAYEMCDINVNTEVTPLPKYTSNPGPNRPCPTRRWFLPYTQAIKNRSWKVVPLIIIGQEPYRFINGSNGHAFHLRDRYNPEHPKHRGVPRKGLTKRLGHSGYIIKKAILPRIQGHEKSLDLLRAVNHGVVMVNAAQTRISCYKANCCSFINKFVQHIWQKVNTVIIANIAVHSNVEIISYGYPAYCVLDKVLDMCPEENREDIFNRAIVCAHPSAVFFKNKNSAEEPQGPCYFKSVEKERVYTQAYTGDSNNIERSEELLAMLARMRKNSNVSTKLVDMLPSV